SDQPWRRGRHWRCGHSAEGSSEWRYRCRRAVPFAENSNFRLLAQEYPNFTDFQSYLCKDIARFLRSTFFPERKAGIEPVEGEETVCASAARRRSRITNIAWA